MWTRVDAAATGAVPTPSPPKPSPQHPPKPLTKTEKGKRRKRERDAIWKAQEGKAATGRDNERRRDSPEWYGGRCEREDSFGNGPREPYGNRSSERNHGVNSRRGSGDNQRPQYSRREQHEPLPYGSPRNTRYREGGGRYGSSEFPGAPRHVKQDTGQSEWQRAEEKRREQEARELQQIGARTTRGSCSSRHWTWILRAQTPRPSWMERPTRSAHGGKRTARLSPIYRDWGNFRYKKREFSPLSS